MKIFKYFFILFFSTMILAFEPQKIVEDWQACQMFSVLDQECLLVRDQAIVVRDQVEDLQKNPQAYGLKIMTVQYNIGLEKEPVRLEQLQQELQIMLAIVGWLESPK